MEGLLLFLLHNEEKKHPFGRKIAFLTGIWTEKSCYDMPYVQNCNHFCLVRSTSYFTPCSVLAAAVSYQLHRDYTLTIAESPSAKSRSVSIFTILWKNKIIKVMPLFTSGTSVVIISCDRICCLKPVIWLHIAMRKLAENMANMVRTASCAVRGWLSCTLAVWYR